MAAWRGEAIVLEKLGKLLRRLAIKIVDFNLLVADLCDFLERSRDVLRQLLAQSVELKAHWKTVRIGPQRRRPSRGCREGSYSPCRASQEVSPVHSSTPLLLEF